MAATTATPEQEIDEAFLGVARNVETGEFLGFYALADNATFVRGGGRWVRAHGTALNRLNGAQMVQMEKSFIDTFDALDADEKTPTDAQIQKGSTTGHPASWKSQQKSKKAAEIEDAGGK